MSSTALVTGGNRGIGLEICRGLVERFDVVLLSGRDIEACERASVGLGSKAIPFQLDMGDPVSVEAAGAEIMKEYSGLDVLVNNAALYLDESVEALDVEMETVRTTFEVNLFGPMRLCQLFIPGMVRRNYGRVVNVSSGYGNIGSMGPGIASYRMSKAALNAMTRIFAAETMGTNVKVNAMGPGWVNTRMGGSGAPRTPREGADTAIWLATLPDDGPTDGYFFDREEVGW